MEDFHTAAIAYQENFKKMANKLRDDCFVADMAQAKANQNRARGQYKRFGDLHIQLDEGHRLAATFGFGPYATTAPAGQSRASLTKLEGLQRSASVGGLAANNEGPIVSQRSGSGVALSRRSSNSYTQLPAAKQEASPPLLVSSSKAVVSPQTLGVAAKMMTKSPSSSSSGVLARCGSSAAMRTPVVGVAALSAN
eukprot:CAMPEP_0206475368 /NCGR_PEP_ID=MMETSP0324_2-20121206/34032_1 /ASSEMBLY_ACC=CAM_ASM_000836 /TAXON_ID=2866 /ORGANISM="Crypthecodinium cohnii, Strain Seligo" /LENGTH=194 /DNA_ID=CAMNT_0053950701 /DNA_START=38 /DNA_END=622 /DNA_ORIENTATION=-